MAAFYSMLQERKVRWDPRSRHLNNMASRSVNKVILIGNLTKSAETKYTPSGVAVTKFAIATNRRWKDKDSSEWKEEVNYTNVVLWQSEKLAEYLQKGKKIYVEGRLQTRSYEGRMARKCMRRKSSPRM